MTELGMKNYPWVLNKKPGEGLVVRYLTRIPL